MARRYLLRWLLATALVFTLVYLVQLRNKAFVENNTPQQAASADPHYSIPDFPTYRPRRQSTDAHSLPFPTTNHTRAVVLGHIQKEDVAWLYTKLEDDLLLERIAYTVDDPHAPFRVPANKGHEAMPYLTYIISRYDRLPDVSIFLHAHQFAWHNNDLLDSNAATMIQRLSSPKVLRDGYVNLRCHIDPGCPSHVHPALQLEPDDKTPEQEYIGKAWQELFPNESPPRDLSAPCCAQFAVSRERLQSVPRARYEALRQWIIDTDVPDHISGRIFEYVWHYLWTGKYELCPDEVVCYCDAYGVCLNNGDDLREWMMMRLEFRENTARIMELMTATELDRQAREHATPAINAITGRNRWLRAEIMFRQQQAMDEGRDPKVRAATAGRSWRQGDGI